MKEIDALELPTTLRYAESHEWARPDGETVVVGIDDYAQDRLGDIVYVELPVVGARFGQGEEFGSVESVKAVSELYMPIAGEVVAINDALQEDPAAVNSQPYERGWLIRVKPDAPASLLSLLDRESYLNLLKG